MHFKGDIMKKIKLILLALLLLIPFNVKAIVPPMSDFYVNDYANVLSSETEEYIIDQSKKLAAVDGTQIVVVTVPDLDGEEIEDYAHELFKSYGIGDSQKNNGLLLLLALEERLMRIEVGDGLEGILPDGKTGRFQDEYMIPYFSEDDFDKGMKNGYDAFYSEIVKLNNLDIDYSEPTMPSSDISYSFAEKFAFFVFIGVFGFIIGVNMGISMGPFTKKHKPLGYTIDIILNLIILLCFSAPAIPFILGFIFGLQEGMKHPYRTRYGSVRNRYYDSGSSFSFGGSSSSGGGGHSSGGGSTRHF